MQKLAIEIDGMAHTLADQAEHDLRRDQWLAGQGTRVMRFPATDVLSETRRQDVLETIAAACGR